jgi:hypothetical protein
MGGLVVATCVAVPAMLRLPARVSSRLRRGFALHRLASAKNGLPATASRTGLPKDRFPAPQPAVIVDSD